jgi:palmitoyltransferase
MCYSINLLTCEVGILLGFIIVWLLFQWSYLKVSVNNIARCTLTLPDDLHRPRLGATGEVLPFATNDQYVTQCLPPETSPNDLDNSVTNSALQSRIDPGPDPAELSHLTSFVPTSLSLATRDQAASSPPLAPPALTPVDPGTTKPKVGQDWHTIQRPIPYIETGPRWCKHCKINKPDRAHHCRHCGVCILQFDRE